MKQLKMATYVLLVFLFLQLFLVLFSSVFSAVMLQYS